MCAALCSLASVANDWTNDITVAAGPFSAPNFGFVFYANSIIGATNAAGKVSLENFSYVGSYSFNYHKQLKSFLALGVKATYEQNACDVFSTDTRPSVLAVMGSAHEFVGHSNIHLLTAMASLQFTYVHTRIVKLYSGVDLGIGFGIWQRSQVWDKTIPAAAQELDPELKKVADFRDKYNNGTSLYALPAFDITPIGIKVGMRVYGLAEINIGYDALFKLGVGVRFD